MKSKIGFSILLVIAILAAVVLSGNTPSFNSGGSKRPSSNDGIRLQ